MSVDEKAFEKSMDDMYPQTGISDNIRPYAHMAFQAGREYECNKPSCYGSGPNGQARAENGCGDCGVAAECLATPAPELPSLRECANVMEQAMFEIHGFATSDSMKDVCRAVLTAAKVKWRE